MLVDDDVEALAETFTLLGGPNRLRILLAGRDGPASVGTIVERVGLSQSLVSHRLRPLTGAERAC